MKAIEDLYEVILNRKENPTEGSYTSYLFEEGLNKILKKIGEEASEIIIAAKNVEVNEEKEELKEEICDLIFHLIVLLTQQGVRIEEIEEILQERRKKVGNLKAKTQSDPNS